MRLNLSAISQLKLVQVQRLPAELRAVAQLAKLKFNGHLCDSNTLKLVRLSVAQLPMHSCSLVTGFALPPKTKPSGEAIVNPRKPRGHVWFRFNDCDHDPTWEDMGWPVEALNYYEAFSMSPTELPRAPESSSGALKRLSRLAHELGIRYI